MPRCGMRPSKDRLKSARKDGQKAATQTLPYHMDRRRTDHQREGLHQIQHHGRKIQDASIHVTKMRWMLRCGTRSRKDGRKAARKYGLKAAKWPQELKSNGPTTHTLTLQYHMEDGPPEGRTTDCIRSSIRLKIQDASIHVTKMRWMLRCGMRPRKDGRNAARKDGLKAAKCPPELQSNGPPTETMPYHVGRYWMVTRTREWYRPPHLQPHESRLYKSWVGLRKLLPQTSPSHRKPRQCHCTRPRALQEEQEIFSCIDIATYPHVKPNPSILAPLLPPTLSSNSSVATSI
ncbi:hypothetical protein Pcinc_034941 [Petrolisthes cinctipes]|uniref:Uncharacterized protein n=1 Tax=Petrolisthes cinctipes TaxID=88211 RepID=A0AAE1ENF4_PETCI|nr:hypothetical protein Pcinc_034941 [Petrolisthes cinctipes]